MPGLSRQGWSCPLELRSVRTFACETRIDRLACGVHTVVETPGYLRRAKGAGMTEAEMASAIDQIAADPASGDVIQGSGGCRKVRVAGRGKGKSGGYRVVTLFGGGEIPVFLLSVISKGDRGNFSDAEVAQMGIAAKTILATARRLGFSSGRRQG